MISIDQIDLIVTINTPVFSELVNQQPILLSSHIIDFANHEIVFQPTFGDFDIFEQTHLVQEPEDKCDDDCHQQNIVLHHLIHIINTLVSIDLAV